MEVVNEESRQRPGDYQGPRGTRHIAMQIRDCGRADRHNYADAGRQSVEPVDQVERIHRGEQKKSSQRGVYRGPGRQTKGRTGRKHERHDN